MNAAFRGELPGHQQEQDVSLCVLVLYLLALSLGVPGAVLGSGDEGPEDRCEAEEGSGTSV